ncbi:MAG: hypothetical protein IKL65_04860 [Bacilli bacterium]|nr:hypothetical protein [Bacilli bacterium]
MKENCEEVKASIYAGMSIFNVIKDYDLIMWNEKLSLNDKKYLSLYLGLINSKNNINLYLKENEIRFKFNINYKLLKQEEYLEVYNLYFVEIFNEINFESIEEHLNYLLNKKVVQSFNRCNGHYVDKIINEKNKHLIKTIN